MSSAPAPKLDPIQPASDADPVVEVQPAAPLETPTPIEYMAVFHLTRTWVQYGIFGFAVLCIVIGAVEALFGR
ncbi:MAG: hypothetical protein ABSE86_13510 [Bryobacteraceae bacterium]